MSLFKSKVNAVSAFKKYIISNDSIQDDNSIQDDSIQDDSIQDDTTTDGNLVIKSSVLEQQTVPKLKIERQKSVLIDASKKTEIKFAYTSDWIKYKLYNLSDWFMLFLLTLLVILQAFGIKKKIDPEEKLKDTFDIDIVLTNMIMMVSVYYGALLALKGYNFNIKVRRLRTGNTPRVNTPTGVNEK